jgi:hypothetical protein
MNSMELQQLLDDLDATHTASDSLSRLVVSRLAKRGVPYKAMLGKLEVGGKVVAPHFWVESNGCVIDYRGARQLGTVEFPHGVFAKAEAATYQGTEIVLDPLPDYMFEQMAR